MATAPTNHDDTLDALELMVYQYLSEHSSGLPKGHFSHAFMTAGERACAVLAEQRPWRWKLQSDGISLREGYHILDPYKGPDGA